MGYALAEEAVARGFEVDLVSGPVSLSAPPGVRIHRVVTADEMEKTMTELLSRAHLVIMMLGGRVEFLGRRRVDGGARVEGHRAGAARVDVAAGVIFVLGQRARLVAERLDLAEAGRAVAERDGSVDGRVVGGGRLCCRRALAGPLP